MNIDAKTRTICLLGHPVKHSFSPIMHNYLFKKYNQNNIYVCYDVKPKDLKESINGIKLLGIAGMNVTIPHKVEVMSELDYISESSKIIGAVNTIKNKGGILEGYNTDGVGFVRSILDKNYVIDNKNIMILGAGGACRSISIELASNNANSIEIRNRTLEKAKEIQSTINEHFKTKVYCSTEEVREKDLKKIDILINTTPIGMESEECPINESIVASKEILVCDIVYKPHNTRLIKWAKKHQLDVVHGIDMLINQGLEAFYIWTGIRLVEEDKIEINNLYEKYIEK